SSQAKRQGAGQEQKPETFVGLLADPGVPQTRDTREPAAYASPLTGIIIDSQLDDWSAAIPRCPIDKLLDLDPTDALGDGGLRNANLWTSPDLRAAFSVGYDPEEQLIYWAVIVRDDNLVIGHESHLDTDAVEVYVEGLRSNRQIPYPSSTDAFYNLDP